MKSEVPGGKVKIATTGDCLTFTLARLPNAASSVAATGRAATGRAATGAEPPLPPWLHCQRLHCQRLHCQACQHTTAEDSWKYPRPSVVVPLAAGVISFQQTDHRMWSAEAYQKPPQCCPVQAHNSGSLPQVRTTASSVVQYFSAVREPTGCRKLRLHIQDSACDRIVSRRRLMAVEAVHSGHWLCVGGIP